VRTAAHRGLRRLAETLEGDGVPPRGRTPRARRAPEWGTSHVTRRNADTGIGAEGSGMSDDRRQPMDITALSVDQRRGGSGRPRRPAAGRCPGPRHGRGARPRGPRRRRFPDVAGGSGEGHPSPAAGPAAHGLGRGRSVVKGLAIGLGTAVALGGVALAATPGCCQPVDRHHVRWGTSNPPRSSAAPGQTDRRTEPAPGVRASDHPPTHPSRPADRRRTGAPTAPPDPAVMGLCRALRGPRLPGPRQVARRHGFERLKGRRRAARQDRRLLHRCGARPGRGAPPRAGAAPRATGVNPRGRPRRPPRPVFLDQSGRRRRWSWRAASRWGDPAGRPGGAAGRLLRASGLHVPGFRTQLRQRRASCRRRRRPIRHEAPSSFETATAGNTSASPPHPAAPDPDAGTPSHQPKPTKT
jgi:hypothetical protein